MHYELNIELHGVNEDEARAVAVDLSRQFAAVVTVTEVTRGRTFADADGRQVVLTFEPSH